MKDIFTVQDYIKIATKDYEGEFRSKTLHFERPTGDPRFWDANSRSDDADKFRRVLSGEKLHVKNNRITVELPKELVGDSAEIQRMVDTVFCTESVVKGVLNLYFKLWEHYGMFVQIVAGSARWSAEGFCAHVYFETNVSFTGSFSRFTKKELKSGVKIKSFDTRARAQAMFEILMNPDGVEYFRGGSDYYLFLKSSDEDVQRRKFYLMSRDMFDFSELELLELVQLFAPHRITKEMEPYLNIYAFPHQLSFYGNRHGLRNDYYINSFIDRENMLKFFRYLKELRDAMDKCLNFIAVEKAADRECEGLRTCRKGIRRDVCDGELVFYLDLKDPNASDDVEQEMRIRKDILSVVMDFLAENVNINSKSKGEPLYAILTYAYNQIISDPLLYTNCRIPSFRELAKSLV